MKKIGLYRFIAVSESPVRHIILVCTGVRYQSSMGMIEDKLLVSCGGWRDGVQPFPGIIGFNLYNEQNCPQNSDRETNRQRDNHLYSHTNTHTSRQRNTLDRETNGNTKSYKTGEGRPVRKKYFKDRNATIDTKYYQKEVLRNQVPYI